MTDEKSKPELDEQNDHPQPKIVEGEVLDSEGEELLQRLEEHPQVMHIIQRRTHQGPLPTPDDLAQYNQIIPNGAERIMAMAEKEQNHRISMNNKEHELNTVIVQETSKHKKIGQACAMATVIVFSLLALYLFTVGQFFYGTVMTGLDLVAIVCVFVTGKVIESKEKV